MLICVFCFFLQWSWAQSDPDSIHLPMGTTVLLELSTPLAPNQTSVGQWCIFKVKQDVIVEGTKVIATGGLGAGVVKKVHNCPSGYCHEPAKIEIEIDHAQAIDGQKVYLVGNPLILRAQPNHPRSQNLFSKNPISTYVRSSTWITPYLN